MPVRGKTKFRGLGRRVFSKADLNAAGESESLVLRQELIKRIDVSKRLCSIFVDLLGKLSRRVYALSVIESCSMCSNISRNNRTMYPVLNIFAGRDAIKLSRDCGTVRF